MKIKDLPQDLQELALKEAKLQGYKYRTVDDYLIEAFDWSDSTQGVIFWNKINGGNF